MHYSIHGIQWYCLLCNPDKQHTFVLAARDKTPNEDRDSDLTLLLVYKCMGQVTSNQECASAEAVVMSRYRRDQKWTVRMEMEFRTGPWPCFMHQDEAGRWRQDKIVHVHNQDLGGECNVCIHVCSINRYEYSVQIRDYSSCSTLTPFG